MPGSSASEARKPICEGIRYKAQGTDNNNRLHGHDADRRDHGRNAETNSALARRQTDGSSVSITRTGEDSSTLGAGDVKNLCG